MKKDTEAAVHVSSLPVNKTMSFYKLLVWHKFKAMIYIDRKIAPEGT